MTRLIHKTEYRSYFAISQQAATFIADLTDGEWLDFVRRADILDLTLATRRPAGVAERLKGSSFGLWELRVTPNSRRGPKIRFFYIRIGKDIFIVRCIRKGPSIKRSDIEAGDRDAKEWKRTQRVPR